MYGSADKTFLLFLAFLIFLELYFGELEASLGT